MPCYHPIVGWRSVVPNANGNYYITFKPGEGLIGLSMSVPCGQCIGCRLERSRQWAIRCLHEASLYSSNIFITLTLDNDHLPSDGSLSVKVFQDFMKRLRQYAHRELKRDGVRFFHCGEYGETFGRPHYHACIFNFDFPDKYRFSTSNGLPLYRSDILEKLWPFGHSLIGSVTFDSAAYVARYIMKKKFGKSAWIHYSDIDWNSGEVLFERRPEYVTMSRRPGIGRNWISEYMDDTYKDDFIVLNGGRKVLPPKYYDSQFEIVNPSGLERVKNSRKRNALKHADNNTAERLRVREIVLASKLKCVPRKLDGDL